LLTRFKDKMKLMVPNDEIVTHLSEQGLDKFKYSMGITKSKDCLHLLLDLVVSDEPMIQQLALEVLQNLYRQTDILAINIQQLQLIMTRIELDELKIALTIVKDLKLLVETSEIWYTPNSGTSDFKFNSTLNILMDKISKSVEYRSPNSIMSEPEGERLGFPNKKPSLSFVDYPQEKVYEMIFLTEELSDDQFFKHMYRNLGVFDSLFEFLEYFIESGDLKAKGFSYEPIRLIFTFLNRLCINCQENKNLFTEERIYKLIINLIEKSLEHGTDFMPYFLLKEIFMENNQGPLSSLSFCTSIMEHLFSFIRQVQFEDVRKSIFVDILSLIVRQNGFVVKANQNTVIKRLFSSSDNKIVLPKEQIKFSLEHLDSEMKRMGPPLEMLKYTVMCKMWILPPKINYVVSLFNLLTICGDGKNAFSENIAQQYMPLSDLLDMLMHPKLLLSLKIAFTNFFFHIYLDTERHLNLMNSESVVKIWNFLLSEISEFREDNPNLENVRTKKDDVISSIGIRSFEEDLSSYIILVLFSIENIIKSKVLLTKHGFRIDIQNVMTGCTEIGKMKNMSESASVADHLHGMCEKIMTTTDNILEEVMRLDSKYIGKKKASTSGSKQKMTTFGQSLASIMGEGDRADLKNDNIQQMLEDEEIRELNFATFCEDFKNSEKCKEIVESEFEELIESIVHMDNNTDSIRELNFKNFTKALIEFLDPENENLRANIQIMGIRIIRKYIESTVIRAKAGPSASENIVNQQKQTQIKFRQDKMIAIGVIDLLGKLLKIELEDTVLREVLELTQSMLFGGNREAQMGFYQQLQGDPDNMILWLLRRKLWVSFEVVKQKMINITDLEMKNKLAGKFIDVGRVLNKDEVFQSNLWFCTRIYMILQNLCEQHNETLQNYLRKQNDVDSQTVISREINFISDTALMLGLFLKFANVHTQELGEQMIDFLIESVQGPCLENQKRLFGSKLLEVVKDFMNDHYTDFDNITSIQQILDKKRIIPIVKKIIKLLLSLLEGHSGEEYSQKISSIDFEYLISFLTEDLASFLYLKFRIDIKLPQNQDTAFLTGLMTELVFDQQLANAFEIFFFIKKINALTRGYKEKIRNLKGAKKAAYEFFQHFSAHIEIEFKELLLKVHFIVQPACFFLDDQKKRLILNEINRDTPSDKLQSLVCTGLQLFDTIDHLCYLYHKVYKINYNLLDQLRFFSLLIAFVINFAFMFFFEKRVERFESVLWKGFDDSHPFITTMAILQIVTASLICALWIVIEGPIVINDKLSVLFSEYKKKSSKMPPNTKTEQMKLVDTYLSKTISDIPLSERLEILTVQKQHDNKSRCFSLAEYYISAFTFIISSGNFRYLVFLLISSIMAFSFEMPLLWGIQLLDIIVTLCSLLATLIDSPERHEGSDISQDTDVAYLGSRRAYPLWLLALRLLLPHRHLLYALGRRRRRKYMCVFDPMPLDATIPCTLQIIIGTKIHRFHRRLTRETVLQRIQPTQILLPVHLRHRLFCSDQHYLHEYHFRYHTGHLRR
jgi:hypothetical protein